MERQSLILELSIKTHPAWKKKSNPTSSPQKIVQSICKRVLSGKFFIFVNTIVWYPVKLN